MFFDDYDPTEPFSADEFVTYNNRELADLDAGYDPDASYREQCPDCGATLKIHGSASTVRCRNCGSKFRVH